AGTCAGRRPRRAPAARAGRAPAGPPDRRAPARRTAWQSRTAAREWGCRLLPPPWPAGTRRCSARPCGAARSNAGSAVRIRRCKPGGWRRALLPAAWRTLRGARRRGPRSRAARRIRPRARGRGARRSSARGSTRSRRPAQELAAQAVLPGHLPADHRMARLGERLDGALVLRRVLAGEPERDEEPVVAVHLGRARRFAIDRQDPAPALAGALGDELLHPGAEGPQAGARKECELVAFRACATARDGAEPHREVL